MLVPQYRYRVPLWAKCRRGKVTDLLNHDSSAMMTPTLLSLTSSACRGTEWPWPTEVRRTSAAEGPEKAFEN